MQQLVVKYSTIFAARKKPTFQVHLLAIHSQYGQFVDIGNLDFSVLLYNPWLKEVVNIGAVM